MGYAESHTYRTFTFFGRAFHRVQYAIDYPLSLAATHGVAVAFLSCEY